MSTLPLIALAALTGCAPEPLVCDAAISEHMETLPVLTLSLEAPAAASVSWTIDGETYTADADADTEHRFVLGGAPEETEVSWALSVAGRDDTCAGSITTDTISENFPELTVTVTADGELAGPRFLLGSVFAINGTQNYLLVLNRQGQVVWYHEVESGEFVVDTQLARAGGGILHNVFDSFFREDIAALRRLDIEGQVVEETPTELGHHMFAQLPDGTLTFQSLAFGDWYDEELGSDETVVGDTVVELSPDGQTEQIFSIFDWLSVERNFFFDFPSLYPQGIDWTHGNAIKYDEADSTYTLSLGNAGVLLTFDRATGQPIERYGHVDPGEGIPLAEGAPPFEHQHDPTWLDSGNLLIFTSDFSTYTSGAVEYAVQGGELVEVWRHGLSGEIFSALLGQATRYDNGDTLINFGGTPVLRQVSADDDVLWELRGPTGYGFAQFAGFSSFTEITEITP